MTPKDTVFFLSDMHLGHEYVASLRGFASPAEHDKALFANWREIVPDTNPPAHVWVLGDVILPNLKHNLELLALMPGIKHLITGNHDRAHPSHRDADRYRDILSPRSYFPTFTTIQEFARRKINGLSVLLSHFPYSEPGEDTHSPTFEPRFTQYRLRNEGLPILHGHTHSPTVLSYDYHHLYGMVLQVHVGLDAHGLKPVSLSQITKLLQPAPFQTPLITEVPLPPDSPQHKSVWPA